MKMVYVSPNQEEPVQIKTKKKDRPVDGNLRDYVVI